MMRLKFYASNEEGLSKHKCEEVSGYETQSYDGGQSEIFYSQGGQRYGVSITNKQGVNRYQNCYVENDNGDTIDHFKARDKAVIDEDAAREMNLG